MLFSGAKATTALKCDAQFSKILHAFKADCLVSPSSRTGSGRGQQPGSHVLGAKVLNAFLPQKVEVGKWMQACEAKYKEMVGRVVNLGAFHFQGMSCQRHYPGVEFYGMGVVRLQLEGTKVVILAPWRGVAAFAHQKMGEGGESMPSEATAKFNQTKVFTCIENLSENDARLFMQIHAVHAGTFGIGTLLVIPAGWVVFERTLASHSYSIRKTQMPVDQASVDEVCHLAAMNVGSTRAAEVLCGLAAKLDENLKWQPEKFCQQEPPSVDAQKDAGAVGAGGAGAADDANKSRESDHAADDKREKDKVEDEASEHESEHAAADKREKDKVEDEAHNKN